MPPLARVGPLLAASLVVIAACSSEATSSATARDTGVDAPRPWDGGSACGPLQRFLTPDSCRRCLDERCAAKACFGEGWATSELRGSLCDAFFTCACNCAPDDAACTEFCQPRMGAVCAQCAHDVRKCQEEGECVDACDPDAGGDDAGEVGEVGADVAADVADHTPSGG